MALVEALFLQKYAATHGSRRRAKNRRSTDVTVSAVGRDELPVLQTFVVELGAALSAAGEPVYSATGKVVGGAAESLAERSRWLKRLAPPPGNRASSGSEDQDARP